MHIIKLLQNRKIHVTNPLNSLYSYKKKKTTTFSKNKRPDKLKIQYKP